MQVSLKLVLRILGQILVIQHLNNSNLKTWITTVKAIDKLQCYERYNLIHTYQATDIYSMTTFIAMDLLNIVQSKKNGSLALRFCRFNCTKLFLLELSLFIIAFYL